MKPWMIVAIALIATGGLLFCVAMSALDWDFSKLSTVKYEENRHDINEDFQNITIKTNTADVRILPAAEGEGAYVISQDRRHLYHTVTVQDGELNIERHDERKWYEMIEVDFDDHVLTVYLPEIAYRTLSITINTGDVSLPQEITFENVDVKGNTGDVECRSSTSGALNIQVNTGDIDVQGVSAGEMTLTASTGDIDLESVSCAGDINLRVSTGEVEMENVTCKNLTGKTSTGDINLATVQVKATMTLKTGTGSVYFERCDAADLRINTDTGNVKGTLLSVKMFVAKTDTGSVRVPETFAGGFCRVTTSTGDIHITIAD